MGKSPKQIIKNVCLGRFVFGGQCLAESDDGKKIFVWGGLPDEVVDVEIYKKRKSYLEGIVTKVHKPSKFRIEPEEPDSYLSTSPWQIVDFIAENKFKEEILRETFKREGIDLSKFEINSAGKILDYRNKMEFAFWGDEEGVSLAHFSRGSHNRIKVKYESRLASDYLNDAAQAIVRELNRLEVWAGDLKSLVLRESREHSVVASIYVKKELDFSNFEIPTNLKGLVVYLSNPKSPASVKTKELYLFGDITLQDSILDKNIIYDVNSFFQVNLPMFEVSLKSIKSSISKFNNQKKLKILDLYSGVGSIGVVVCADVFIETDKNNIYYLKENTKNSNAKIIHKNAEDSIETIDEKSIIILDPPRAGLHKKLTEQITKSKPPMVIYLSCNPSTQARDLSILLNNYKIVKAEGYNFFPRTPHIESLVVLELKQ